MFFKINLRRNELLALFFILFVQVVYLLQGSKLYFSSMTLLLGLAVVLGFGFIITRKSNISNKGKLLLSIFVIIVLESFYTNKDTRLPVAMVALFLGMFIEEKKIISWIFWIRLLSLIMVIITGGYQHINTLAVHGGMTLIIFALYTKDKNKKIYRCMYLLIYAILVLVTKSGSMAICGGSAIFLFILIDKKVVKKVLLSKLIKFIYPIALVMNLLFAILVNQKTLIRWGINIRVPIFLEKFVKWIDIVTSSRISLAQYSLIKFGISLRGNNVDFNSLQLNPNGYFSLDSGMMWLIQQWGIIMTIIFMILTIHYITYIQKMKQYQMIVMAIAIALWSLNEDILLSAGMNMLFYFMGKALLRKNKRNVIRYEYT